MIWFIINLYKIRSVASDFIHLSAQAVNLFTAVSDSVADAGRGTWGNPFGVLPYSHATRRRSSPFGFAKRSASPTDGAHIP